MVLSRLFGSKKKEEQIMQPTTPTTTPPASTETAAAAPQQAPAVPTTASTPVVQEPKKAPEIKTLDISSPKDKDDDKPNALRPEHRPHAFVIMPFGKKKGIGLIIVFIFGQ